MLLEKSQFLEKAPLNWKVRITMSSLSGYVMLKMAHLFFPLPRDIVNKWKPFWPHLCLSEQPWKFTIKHQRPEVVAQITTTEEAEVFSVQYLLLLFGQLQLYFSWMLFKLRLYLQNKLGYFLISTSHYHKMIIYGFPIVSRESGKRIQWNLLFILIVHFLKIKEHFVIEEGSMY